MSETGNIWPIEEVLCTIHFSPLDDWDVTAFGKYYSRIENEYSKREQMKILKRALEEETGIFDDEPCQEETLMRFSNKQESRIVQLSRDTIVVNIRPPYPGWEEFKPEIMNRIEDYVNSFEPDRIDSLGLRYVNKFSEPGKEFAIEQIFCDNKYVPGIIFEKKSPFMSQLLFMNGDDILTEINTGQIEPEEENLVSIILDIEVSSLKKIEIGKDSLSEILDGFHDRLNTIFKGCISEHLREKFGFDGEQS